MKIILYAFLTLFFTAFLMAKTETRLLRFPAVHENQVVFTYAGDLYTVDIHDNSKNQAAQVARKLTHHKGFEMFPRFSPDGKHIAFTAQYDGNTEVYLMDARGGIPKRLTYTANIPRDDVSDRIGPNNIVMGWKHDNLHIVFRSRMYALNGQLFLTTVHGDLHRQLPLPRGGFCSFSPDNTQLAYNRIFREFRTWKRYRGGQTDDIWVYDFNSKKTENITRHPAQDVIPMWKDNNIYFLSDRGPFERMNLYVYDTQTGKTRQLTDFKEFDIKFPSLGKEKIAFENGGWIYLFHTKTEKLRKLKIIIRENRSPAGGGKRNVSKYITGYDISPGGKRALFNARGEIFTVPPKSRNTRNLTNTPGVHERNPQWSPDGKWIAFVSDLDGENEIYIIPRYGSSKPIPITTDGDAYIYEIKWSPDSKKILWSDNKLRLRVVDINKKNIIDVTRAKYTAIRDFNWSPDSLWIAYSKIEIHWMTYDAFIDCGLGKIYLYSLEKRKNYDVTAGWYSSYYPVFSPCGKYLFFVSHRDFTPTEVIEPEFNFIFQDTARIYLVTLSKAPPSPFRLKSDNMSVPVLNIDTEGISSRVIGLPIKPARYMSLSPAKNKLYYLRQGSRDKNPVLLMFDLEKPKERNFGQVNGFKISANLKKMLISKADYYSIIDLPVSRLKIKKTLNLKHMNMDLGLESEWKNIFLECWRQMRDFFYVPNMHGINWEKMRKRYEPLLEYVNHRNDLTYIIGEMIGELNAGHAYVGDGDHPEIKKIKTGLLGARLERDAKTGYYRIARILNGENWNKELVSPLTAIGVNAGEGDYIIAVNGTPTSTMRNIYKALVNTVGKQVRLTLNTIPSAKGTREVVVVPIGNEAPLYYYNWVQNNIETVHKATGGKVGYIHIPDMMPGGLSHFFRSYYPQLHKKALIIDERGNGGGYFSELIIERLRREILSLDIYRHTQPNVNPLGMMTGPKVCLIDEFAGSDGDFFAYRFKKHKVGKLIGKCTWGGAIAVGTPLTLPDGGTLYIPVQAAYDLEGKEWIIEGHGVDPDIVVDNDPANEFAGIDEQLNKAIEVILEELKEGETHIPLPPPAPDKSMKKKK
ncbi:MAG: protease [Candidatus Aminicenantes bacterium]|nr:protease [Candidatus Aminicenantes bacterium]NIM77554.1 protease [Candidatus Aminicenantes bacterium]NIN16875.1 protease [Candidatus Aminicenantes bacterium]NIN40763.1 protease [Candidatus Aminicenantes bacterium]NIN83572.1 protease [Candidatus Aminicenantes bacterium]